MKRAIASIGYGISGLLFMLGIASDVQTIQDMFKFLIQPDQWREIINSLLGGAATSFVITSIILIIFMVFENKDS